MEGVGARLGRSSTRFAPAAAFTGPVRKWTKRWVPLQNPNPSNPRANASATSNSRGNGEPHLLLFKWTPLSSSPQTDGSDEATASAAPEGQLKRRFRYVPVSVTGELKQDSAENSDSEAGSSPRETPAFDRKPEANDVMMEEAQAVDNGQERNKGANETNLDLNLS